MCIAFFFFQRNILELFLPYSTISTDTFKTLGILKGKISQRLDPAEKVGGNSKNDRLTRCDFNLVLDSAETMTVDWPGCWNAVPFWTGEGRSNVITRHVPRLQSHLQSVRIEFEAVRCIERSSWRTCCLRGSNETSWNDRRMISPSSSPLPN